VVAAVIRSGRALDEEASGEPRLDRHAGWCGDDAEVAAVAAMLVACGWLDLETDHADYLAEPGRWSAIRELWVRSGRPTAAAPDWELFSECLD